MPYKNIEDKREARKRWYRNNKDVAKQRVIKRENRIKERINEYKLTLSCQTCGENHPACLDFHHKDPTDKITNISNLYRKGWRWDKILDEIAKCDILCSNCHRKLHYDGRQKE